MQTPIANLVYGVISRGIYLKERVLRGDSVQFEQEQGELKKLLNDPEGRRYPDFVGDGGDPRVTNLRRDRAYLGIKYALTAWLDEIMILHTRPPWSDRWKELSLERQLFNTNLRADDFWEQASRAELPPAEPDSLEAFFLCVMLGFRGKYASQPNERNEPEVEKENASRRQELGKWTTTILGRISPVLDVPPPVAAAQEPPTNVPHLRGRKRYERMCHWATIIVPPAIFILWYMIIK